MKQLHIQTYLLRLSAVIILLGQLACGKEPAVPPDKGGDGSGTGTSVETLAGGESRILKEATSGKTPANIIILGDGFTKEDYTDNGPFYTAAKRAMDGLFSVEPFKTYSSYFRVQTVTAYSKEQGTSFKNSSSQKTQSSPSYWKEATVLESLVIMRKYSVMRYKHRGSITRP